MKVELRIDPGCDGMSVVINAPALTDEVKALAARLEGGGVLVGWQGGRSFPVGGGRRGGGDSMVSHLRQNLRYSGLCALLQAGQPSEQLSTEGESP